MPVDFVVIKMALAESAQAALNEFVDELAEEIRANTPVSTGSRKKITLDDVSGKTTLGNAPKGRKLSSDVTSAELGYGRFGYTKLATDADPTKRNALGRFGYAAPETATARIDFRYAPEIIPLMKGRATRARRGTARKHAPGTLKRSIKAVHAVEEGGRFIASVKTDVRYAQYVEHGVHGNERNRGFFSRPVEAARDQAAARMASKFRRIG